MQRVRRVGQVVLGGVEVGDDRIVPSPVHEAEVATVAVSTDHVELGHQLVESIREVLDLLDAEAARD